MTKFKSYLCTSSSTSSSGNRDHLNGYASGGMCEKSGEESRAGCRLPAREVDNPLVALGQHCKTQSITMTTSGNAGDTPVTSAEKRPNADARRQYGGSRESKWWRSCWNGNQLDGDLLYKTIKAQQERRLATQMLSQVEGESSDDQPVLVSANNSPTALVDNSHLSYVYASPKPRQQAEIHGRCSQNEPHSPVSHHATWQSSSLAHDRSPVASSLGHSGSSPTSSGSSSTSSASSRSPIEGTKQVSSKPERSQRDERQTDEGEDDEDLLSDPLYASILGTSKQLQAISAGSSNLAHWSPGRKLERQQQVRMSSCNGNMQNELCASSRKSDETSSIIVNNSHPNAGRTIASPSRRRKLSKHLNLPSSDSDEHQQQQHVYDNLPGNNASDPAWIQLKSLVERCLEVQRATQNSSLLPIGDNQYDEEIATNEDEHSNQVDYNNKIQSQCERRQASNNNSGDDQTKLLQLNGASQSKRTTTTNAGQTSAMTEVRQVNGKEKCHKKSNIGYRLDGNSCEQEQQELPQRQPDVDCTGSAGETGGQNRPDDQRQQVVRGDGGKEEAEAEKKVTLVNDDEHDLSKRSSKRPFAANEQPIESETSAKLPERSNERLPIVDQPRNRSAAPPSPSDVGEQLEPANSDTCQSERVSCVLSLLSVELEAADVGSNEGSAAANGIGPTNLATNEEECRALADTPSPNGRWMGQVDENQHRDLPAESTPIHCHQNSLKTETLEGDSKPTLGVEQQVAASNEHSRQPASGHEIVVDAIPELDMSPSALRCREQDGNQSSAIRVREAAESGCSREDDAETSTTTIISKQHNMKAVKETSRNRNIQIVTPPGDIKKDPSNQLVEAARQNDLAKFFNQYKGAGWRSKQLVSQIPQQDVKLLALSNGDCCPESELPVAGLLEAEDLPISGQGADEIKFIRGQRKAASQFKASLYYLNPIQAQKQRNGSIATSWLRGAAQNSTASQQSKRVAQQHCCFKCKLPIALNTTCVRVDNLQLKEQGAERQNSDGCQANIESSNDNTRESSHQKTANDQQKLANANAIPLFDVNGRQETISNLQTRTGATGNRNLAASGLTVEEQFKNDELVCGKSVAVSSSISCDEGLGTGSSANSSEQSSTAGSHCDDRETPPNVVERTDEDTPALNDREMSPGQVKPKPKQCATDICDNNSKLSFNKSLNEQSTKRREFDSKSPTASGNKVLIKRHQRNRSLTLADLRSSGLKEAEEKGTKTAAECQKSKKSRALTWSASISSLSAAFKLGSSSSSKGISSSQTQRDDLNANSSILFHTDCFTCSTCNELLVDLRALIYINHDHQHRHQQQSKQPATQIDHRKSANAIGDSDYVNLDSTEVGQQAENDKQCLLQELSLFCHRHFVELFKPRCRQCDCLILDEECTEAEGKVWHIKHFCCTECKVPLGGQQYIIVDQKQQQQHRQTGVGKRATGLAAIEEEEEARKREAQSELGPDKRQGNNAPYCLKCFDLVFGETCEQCSKLITCDSGAINHERRCWHASADCFKCHRCTKSLLGHPFLPSSDGHIYCSLRCSEENQAVAGNGPSVSPARAGVIALSLAAGDSLSKATPGKLHLANYCDPRAPHGALQHQLILSAASTGNARADQHKSSVVDAMQLTADSNNNGSINSAARQRVGLLRHQALIDYLLANARSDETSHQLLNYLYNQFNLAKGSGLAGNPSSRGQSSERDELTPIGRQEEERLMERIGATMELIAHERANRSSSTTKLQQNESALENNRTNADRMRRNKLNPFLIDSFGTAANRQLESSAKPATGPMGTSAINERLQQQMDDQQRQQVLANYINLDCVVFNEKETSSGANKHPIGGSTTTNNQKLTVFDSVDNVCAVQQRDGIMTKLVGKQSQYNFKVSQCSPAASLISNEGTISDHSATSSGVSSSTAPTFTGVSGRAAANNDDPRKSHSPLSSSSSRSSVSSANSFGNQQQVGAGGNSNGPAATETGLRQPVRPINSIAATLERRRRVQPITELSVLDLLTAADNQLDLQRQQTGPDGFEQLVSHFESSKRMQQQQQPNNRQTQLQRGAQFKSNSMETRGNQQESFFFELAQRLPKTAPSQRAPAAESLQQRQQITGGSLMPLDTNGLPIVEGDVPTGANSGAARIITDHYSTVNKTTKLGAKQVAPGGTSANTSLAQQKSAFFAITSPLLGCQANGAEQSNSGSSMISSSLLSVPTPASAGADQVAGSGTAPSQLLLQAAGSQRNLAKPVKSVSFDPALKDPPCSSGSMTLGRSSTLKSALKTSGSSSWLPLEQSFEQQLQHQLDAGTMPAALAAQLKAGGSLSAYSAYYDEHGRRIRLSSLLDHQLRPQPIEGGREVQVGEPESKQASKSLLSGALSRLSLTSGQSSRGGRRRMREQQQQQQQENIPTVFTAQPTSSSAELFVQPANLEQQAHLYGPSVSGLQAASSSRRRRPRRSSSSSSSHRRPPARHYRSSRRRASGGSGRRYYGGKDCYESDDEDSSRCSTCSGSSDDDSDESYSDSSRSSSADSSDASQTPYSSTDCSSDSDGSHSDDDYTDESSSSGSSRSSSACSSHSGHYNTGSSRASSPASQPQSVAAGQDRGASSGGKSSRSAQNRRQSSGGCCSERRHGRGCGRRRRSSGAAQSSGSGRQEAARTTGRRRSSRSSSRSSSSRSSKRSGSRRTRSNANNHRRRHEHRRRHRKSTERSRSHRDEKRHRSSDAGSRRSSRSVAHLQPLPPIMAPQYNPNQSVARGGIINPNFFVPPPARINPQLATANDLPPTMVSANQQHLLRAKSPSTLSTDSKSVNNDCKII